MWPLVATPTKKQFWQRSYERHWRHWYLRRREMRLRRVILTLTHLMPMMGMTWQALHLTACWTLLLADCL